jgi:DNA recombination protein RmuC
LGIDLRNELRAGREESRGAAKELREEVSVGIRSMSEVLRRTLENHGALQQTHYEGMARQLGELGASNHRSIDSLRETFDLRVKDLQKSNESRLSEIRVTFDARARELQDSNEKKLDEMCCTVDEKLHDTLEKRLGEQFKLVSDRLETVHRGLGEMKGLATGVGDLKRVLTNVKARGTWAEVQLGAILEQILAPQQFARNVCVRPGELERVEYAVRLPGSGDSREECVWLPIDSKWPKEDYARLQAAADASDQASVQVAQDALLRAVRIAAKDIYDKYVNPPATTDFGIMFLATEGLYAEVVRQPDFLEELQNRYRVVVAGPTTLAAILTSLRVGFQTLAIEQRATEVWKVLGAVKTEFVRFGDVLAKVQRQLALASKTVEETSKRTRLMKQRLQSVEEMNPAETSEVLRLPSLVDEPSEEPMASCEPANDDASAVPQFAPTL